RFVDTRNSARAARVAEINAVKETLPQAYFEVPISALDLPDNMIEALEPLGTVGEIMLRFLIDESRLKKLLGTNNDAALRQVQTALDKLVIPDADAPQIEDVDETVVEAIASVDNESDHPEMPVSVVAESVQEIVSKPVEDVINPLQEVADEKLQILQSLDTVLDFDEDEDDDVARMDDKRKKEKQKRRQLVYDEDTGQTFAKRRRKGGRKNDSWDGDDF
ncbi:MAG: hypothetical protein KJ043_15755, partial [Anaerolineae bacterium]|nr:hypothetical protein [Anaerolineae bacterium]